MRHHTILHEVDLKIMERRRAKQDSARSSVTTPQDSEVTSSHMQEMHIVILFAQVVKLVVVLWLRYYRWLC